MADDKQTLTIDAGDSKSDLGFKMTPERLESLIGKEAAADVLSRGVDLDFKGKGMHFGIHTQRAAENGSVPAVTPPPRP